LDNPRIILAEILRRNPNGKIHFISNWKKFGKSLDKIRPKNSENVTNPWIFRPEIPRIFQKENSEDFQQEILHNPGGISRDFQQEIPHNPGGRSREIPDPPSYCSSASWLHRAPSNL
jgi:hypothetical protein